MATIRQTLSRDPVFLAFLAFFGFLHIPYVFPILDGEQLALYSGRVNFVLMPMVMAAVLVGLGRLRINVEIRFWRYVAYAYGVWWLATVVQVLWPESWKSSAFGVATDGFFALYYLIWLMAVGLNPHRSTISTLIDRIRRLRAVGTIILILGLSVYFLLVPGRLGAPSIAAWVPSLFLYVVFDLILFTRLGLFAIRAITHRWRMLYGLLAVAQLMNSYLDLQEALIYQGVFEWRWGASLDFMWNIPLLVLVIAARLRHHNFEDRSIEDELGKELHEWQISRQSPLMFSAFVFPLVHIFAYRFDLLDETTQAAREGVVMVCLLLLFALVVLETNLIHKGLRQAAAQRQELHDLRIAQEVAVRSDSARNRFLANVSHEIRTPMNGILGIAEMLLGGSLADDDRRRVQMLRSSAQGLLQIIDDILDYTKIDAGELTVEQQRFSLPTVLREVVELQEQTARLKRLSVELEPSEDLPEWVVGDPTRLRQVLTNLIANAIKFTPEGTISVRAARDQRNVRFDVRDSGIGIAEKDQERLFEPFTQVDGSRSRQYGGAGLGLAICRQIVTRQGGEIGLESRPGEGSRFWFTLPLTETRAPSHQRKETTELQLKSRPRILLAEDNLINQMVAVHQLEDLGADVETASDGLGVLDALEKGQHDIILMDCQMPKMDGYEATRRIRTMEQGTDKRIPIVALTAHAFSEDRERCMAAGMDDYLSKPYTRADLANLLQRWLDPDVSGLDDSWSEYTHSQSLDDDRPHT